MNFSDLSNKLKLIESVEPVNECGAMGECGMTSAPSKQQDSVSMNVSMNASGAGGIRDLMNILKNIDDIANHDSDDQSSGVIIDQPSEEPDDIEVNLDSMDDVETEDDMGVPPPDQTPMASEMPVEEEPEIANRPDPKTMAIAAVSAIGDDLFSKGKEAPKQAGGGNPWNVNESALAAKLMKHYEEVKSRNNVTEGYWGWDPPDEDEGPEYWYGYGKREIEEIDLSAPYDLTDVGIRAGETFNASVVADCNGEDFSIDQVLYYDEESDDMKPIDLKLAGQQWVSNVEAECSDSLQTEYTGRDDDYDDYDYDDGGRGWQDAQNAWERGRDSRVREARETDFDINNPRAAGKMQGAMDREFKDFKRREHEAEYRREQEIRQAEAEANQNAQAGPWYINSGGKILRTGGQPKVFDSLRGAKGYVKTIRKSRPNYSAILTRNPEDTDPLDFMKRSLRLNYNFTSEPGATASGYRPGMYNHFRGAEGDKTLQKAYEYFVALSKDPNTDPEIQQKSAADAEAMAKELEYRKQNGTTA